MYHKVGVRVIEVGLTSDVQVMLIRCRYTTLAAWSCPSVHYYLSITAFPLKKMCLNILSLRVYRVVCNLEFSCGSPVCPGQVWTFGWDSPEFETPTIKFYPKAIFIYIFLKKTWIENKDRKDRKCCFRQKNLKDLNWLKAFTFVTQHYCSLGYFEPFSSRFDEVTSEFFLS